MIKIVDYCYGFTGGKKVVCDKCWSYWVFNQRVPDGECIALAAKEHTNCPETVSQR